MASKRMDKELASKALDTILEVCEGALAEMGLKITATKGSYSPIENSATIRIDLMPDIQQSAASIKLTSDMLRAGLAPAGTTGVYHFDKEIGDYSEVRILQSRRTKYVFEWVGYEDSHGKRLANFKNFKLKSEL